MYEMIRKQLKMILVIILVIILTHTLFFIAYGYYMSGDPFIALKNFYHIMYDIG